MHAPPTDLNTASEKAAASFTVTVYLLLAALSAAFVVYGSLIPFDYHPHPFAEAVDRFAQKWDPFFQSPYSSIRKNGGADLMANFMLLIPFAFFAMGALGRGRSACWPAAFLVIPTAAVLSILVEFAQVYFPPRMPSPNDVAAQTAGAILGTALWSTLGVRLTAWFRSLWHKQVRHAAVVKILLAVYTAIFLVCQLLPLNITIRPVEIYHKLRSARVTYLPFTDAAGLDLFAMELTVVLMIPVGHLLALVARRQSGLRTALGLGALAAAGIELLQLFVPLRQPSATDFLLGTFGAAVGGWLADHVGPGTRRPLVDAPSWQRYGRVIRLAILLFWLAAFGGYKWAPFHFRWPANGLAAQMRASFRLPFYYQFWNSPFEAAAQLARDAVGPLLLGMLLASLASGKRRRRWACGLLAAAVAVVGEAGQWFFPPHTADSTTMVVGAVAGLAGAWLYGPFWRTFLRTPDARDREEMKAATGAPQP